MIVYKVPMRNVQDECNDDANIGYYWTTSKRGADRFFKCNGADPKRGDKIEKIEFAMNKTAVIAFLNNACNWPDNG